MPMKETRDGLVIWQVKTGEADRVITLLTPGGLVTAYAKNSLLPRNKLTTPTALLSYSNFELFPGKNMYSIDDASSNHRFVRLYSDVSANALAMYFCELLKAFAPVDDSAVEFLSLALNALFALNEDIWSRTRVKSVFELKLSALAGYMPDLDSCGSCGRTDATAFRFESQQGSYLCERCAEASEFNLDAPPSTLKAMRHIMAEIPARVFSFELGETPERWLSDIAEQYMITCLERYPQTLEFYHALADK